MDRPYRVLSIDGGGLRGYYTAQYLTGIVRELGRRRGFQLDLGKAFDLIVGTSTGAIIGAGLAAGVPADRIANLYKEWGAKIFPLKVPSGICEIGKQELTGARKRALGQGTEALREALTQVLGNKTLGELHSERRIGLSVTAVELASQRGYVFKTPHLGGQRDSATTIVDTLLATSAAPIFRSVALLESEFGSANQKRAFVDGGLWANNPILVGLTDALRATASDPTRPIEIYAVSTCTPRSGEDVQVGSEDRGLREWRFGADALTISIAAQEHVYDEMARMLATSFGALGRDISICRFPRRDIPTNFVKHMNIDDASEEAFSVYARQAETDRNHFLSIIDDENNSDGRNLLRLLNEVPAVEVGNV